MSLIQPNHQPAEPSPSMPDDLLAWWQERSGQLQFDAGMTRGRAETVAFGELGNLIRAATMPKGRGPRRCAACGERCANPMPARAGIAGVVVCNGQCYSALWVRHRQRIDDRLREIGISSTASLTLPDAIAIEHNCDGLEPQRA